MRESVVKTAVVRFAEGAGWLVRHVEWRGRNSCPDTVMFRAGITTWVEFKANGEVPRPDQDREFTRMRTKGAIVLVIDSIEHGRRLLA
jgi:hypothetical protein